MLLSAASKWTNGPQIEFSAGAYGSVKELVNVSQGTVAKPMTILAISFYNDNNINMILTLEKMIACPFLFV